ncbi:hypothetical protein E2562_005243 [Oryza meyeriana var. granulata]|uniref:Uncharacterized protein n=1 Tax=Oryza meyeriana var. granulata TaxID=110450 RepID=A0A6G1EF24_9ORYZ|nr:hypothetical protein E2562_005243 [Oryza meyeriana var. granulata]
MRIEEGGGGVSRLLAIQGLLQFVGEAMQPRRRSTHGSALKTSLPVLPHDIKTHGTDAWQEAVGSVDRIGRLRRIGCRGVSSSVAW